MARKFHIEGTKTFLIATVVLVILAVWHIWDGWFPRASWLEKYPDYPGDWFYTYNRVMGVIFGIVAVICAYIHKVVK